MIPNLTCHKNIYYEEQHQVKNGKGGKYAELLWRQHLQTAAAAPHGLAFRNREETTHDTNAKTTSAAAVVV